MKTYLRMGAFLGCLALAFAAGLLVQGGRHPDVLAQDQQTMNRQADQAYRAADRELNSVYRKVMATITDGSEKQKLVDAELAWIKYRDLNAQVFAYPNRGGLIYPLIWSGAATRVTRQRIAELRLLLEDRSSR